MTGCLKEHEFPNRRPESKYFTPYEMFAENTFLPPYFSGAGYFMSKTALSKLMPLRHTVPILPLDDVYIGALIAKAKMTKEMVQGISLCTGVGAQHHTATSTSGWTIRDALQNPCSMCGLTLFHPFPVAKTMLRVFYKLKTSNVRNMCDYGHIIVAISKRWEPDQQKIVADEWRVIFGNYKSYLNQY